MRISSHTSKAMRARIQLHSSKKNGSDKGPLKVKTFADLKLSDSTGRWIITVQIKSFKYCQYSNGEPHMLAMNVVDTDGR